MVKKNYRLEILKKIHNVIDSLPGSISSNAIGYVRKGHDNN
ncbi:MAG: hypothetical protein QW725_07830 [Ignisphaera sp.]